MALFGLSGSNSNTSYNQTNTPILSPYWTGAFGNASGNLNSGGATPGQQTGIDYFTGQLKNPQTPGYYNYLSNAIGGTNEYQRNSTDNTNNAEWQLGSEFDAVNQNGLAPIFNKSAPQVTGVDISAGGPLVNAQSGASMSSPYSSLYGSAVVDPSLQAYDYGTDRAFSALDARTAGAGAFGNTRSGLGYSDLGAQSALGRGQLASGLLNQGATTAFNLGQQDATRDTGAQTTNATNILGNNQFNAGLLNNRQQFNVNAQQQDTGQKLQAAQQWSANVSSRLGVTQQQLANQMGMSQQLLNNVVGTLFTAQGVDQQAAQSLVSSGQITEEQLMQLVQLAQAANGQNITGNSNTTKFSAGVGFGSA